MLLLFLISSTIMEAMTASFRISMMEIVEASRIVEITAYYATQFGGVFFDSYLLVPFGLECFKKFRLYIFF